MTLFVLDRDFATLKQYEKLFSELGFSVEAQYFTDVSSLLKAANAAHPDAILLEKEAYNSLIAIKKLQSLNREQNIILVSEEEGIPVEAADMNLSGCLTKPLTAGKIVAQLKNLRYPISAEAKKPEKKKEGKNGMSEQVKHFRYLVAEDYDATVKINDEEVEAYSKKKLDELYPDGDMPIVGETFEAKKRDKEKDVGSLEIAETKLYISAPGTHGSIFRKKAAFLKVTDGSLKKPSSDIPAEGITDENKETAEQEEKEEESFAFIALLKLRIWLIILLGALCLGILVGGGFALGKYVIIPAISDHQGQGDNGGKDKPGSQDPDIKPIESDVLTVSGTVYFGEEKASGASLTLLSGSTVVATATTDADGKYLFAKVKSGVYNIAVSFGKQNTMGMIFLQKISVVRDFYLTDADLSVKVEINGGEDTPQIGISGVDEEAKKYITDGKRVEITFVATKLEDTAVPEVDQTAIEEKSGDLNLTYFDFELYKEVFSLASGASEGKEDIGSVDTPFEIVVPYNTYRAIGPYVFRSIDGEVEQFEEIKSRPAEGEYVDGTFYATAEYVFIYASSFSTVAIGSTPTQDIIRGSDTFTYSHEASIDLNTGKIKMMYEHDADATHNARIELYLVSTTGNIFISSVESVPPGYSLTGMTLASGITLNSVGVYEGLMRIIYLNGDSTAATQVEIPLKVYISK